MLSEIARATFSYDDFKTVRPTCALRRPFICAECCGLAAPDNGSVLEERCADGLPLVRLPPPALTTPGQRRQLWRRANPHGREPSRLLQPRLLPRVARRVVYKTLNMLDYLLRHGSERVIEDCRDHLREIKKLQKFEYVDGDGKDCGQNVRRTRLALSP